MAHLKKQTFYSLLAFLVFNCDAIFLLGIKSFSIRNFYNELVYLSLNILSNDLQISSFQEMFNLFRP